jgi:hypothetical protein
MHKFWYSCFRCLDYTHRWWNFRPVSWLTSDGITKTQLISWVQSRQNMLCFSTNLGSLSVAGEEMLRVYHVLPWAAHKITWMFLTCSLHIQSRKLKTLLETTFGWDLMANPIDEDDEVNQMTSSETILLRCCTWLIFFSSGCSLLPWSWKWMSRRHSVGGHSVEFPEEHDPR